MLKRANKPDIVPIITEKTVVQTVEKVLLAVSVVAMVIIFIAAKNTHAEWSPTKDHIVLGAPLKARPYFEKPPAAGTTADIFPTEATSSTRSDQSKSVQKDKILSLRRDTALVSVKAYLTLLEHTDQEKHALLQELVALNPAVRSELNGQQDAIADATPSSSGSGIQTNGETEVSASSDATWQSLSSNLEQSMPPPSCIELNASYLSYLGALHDLLTAMTDLPKHIATDKGNEEAVARQAVQSAKERLEAETAATDDTLRALCSHLGLPKSFDISNDVPN